MDTVHTVESGIITYCVASVKEELIKTSRVLRKAESTPGSMFMVDTGKNDIVVALFDPKLSS